MPLSRRAMLAGSLVLVMPAAARAEKKVSAASVNQVIEIAKQLSLPAGLPAPFVKAMPRIAEKLKTGEIPGRNAWQALIEKHKATLREEQVEPVMRWLVRESLLEPNVELAATADRARFFVEQRLAVSARITALRALKKASPPYKLSGLSLTAAYSRKAPSTKPSGPKSVTKAELDQELQSWEEKLNSVGDDAQLASLDLQSALQEQQQALQVMASISKLLHDTAMAVIRNIRA